MAPTRETLWSAQANRWNIAKLIVGLVCFYSLSRASLALMALGGSGFPMGQINPLQTAITHGLIAAVAACIFHLLERARRHALRHPATA